MTAAGIGLTLTAAATVIFAELHWTPGVLAQAEDRTHRIGQVNSVNVMYCVCKEKDLSVDLSLWAMIGKKVNNLGRMIDGEKNAALNANDVENSTTELASFFAENNPNQKLPGESNSTPVKGSIQSFFVPKASQAPSQDPMKVCKKMQQKKDQKTIQFNSASPVRKVQTWTCEMCTFVNEKRKYNLSCEMCGQSRQRQVTPCGENAILKSSMSTKTTCNSPIVDLSRCHGENKELQSSAVLAKKLLKQTQPITIEISEEKDSQKVSLVQFKVSENSGRIAIFGIDGVSLNFNFDIDEVLAESTGEILEKYVKRTMTQQRECISPNEVKFNNGGVRLGE